MDNRPSSVILIAHSMGGIVAREVFTLDGYEEDMVNLLITLSTPHAIPPTTFSRTMHSIYSNNKHYDENITTISISGGSADTLLPSDVTFAPVSSNNNTLNILSTAIVGVWAPISHQAIVWCDQLRRKLSTAILLSIDSSNNTKLKSDRLSIFKNNLLGISDGNVNDEVFDLNINASLISEFGTLNNISNEMLAWSVSKPPPKWVTGNKSPKLKIITNITPQMDYKSFENKQNPLSILACKYVKPLKDCRILEKDESRLLPYLKRTDHWLPDHQGADENKLMYSVEINSDHLDDKESLVIYKNSTINNVNNQWLTFQYVNDDEVIIDASFFRLLTSSVPLIKNFHGVLPLSKKYRISNSPTTSLMVYNIESQLSECTSTPFNDKELFQPLLSHLVESNKGIEEVYYPDFTNPSRETSLQSHFSHSPYLTIPNKGSESGILLELTIDSLNLENCFPFSKFNIKLDILKSLSKFGNRFRSTLIGYCVGIWVIAFRNQLRIYDESNKLNNLLTILIQISKKELILTYIILTLTIALSDKYDQSINYFLGINEPKLWILGIIIPFLSFGLITSLSLLLVVINRCLTLIKAKLPKFKINKRTELMMLGILTITFTLLLPSQIGLTFLTIIAIFVDSDEIFNSIKVLLVILSPFFIPTSIVWIRNVRSNFIFDYDDIFEFHNPFLVIPFTAVLINNINKEYKLARFTSLTRSKILEEVMFGLMTLLSFTFSGKYAFIIFEFSCILMIVIKFTRSSN